jgi:hypothetical protein
MRKVAGAAVIVATALMGGCESAGSLPWLSNLTGASRAPTTTPVAAPPAVPMPLRADGVVEARRCGTTLGIAARCNLMRDDRDFAVLRFAALDGLGARYGAVIGRNELAEQLDLAALDRITSISACTLAPADLPRVETAMRKAMDQCTRR